MRAVINLRTGSDGSGGLRRADVAAGGVGALLVWASAAVHLHLYAIGYDQIPVVGRLFLLQGLAGILTGALILALRHPLAYLGGAGYMVASLAGFLTSLWFGLFGFRDSLAAPYAGLAMATEISGGLVLVTAAGLWMNTRRRRRSAVSP